MKKIWIENGQRTVKFKLKFKQQITKKITEWDEIRWTDITNRKYQYRKLIKIWIISAAIESKEIE